MDPRGTVGRIYKEDHYTLLHTKYESSEPCGCRVDPRGTAGRIYKENHYTLLHTKYESFGPCGFEEEDILKFFP